MWGHATIILYSVEILLILVSVHFEVIFYHVWDELSDVSFRLDVHRTSENKTTPIGFVALCNDTYLLFFQDCFSMWNRATNTSVSSKTEKQTSVFFARVNPALQWLLQGLHIILWLMRCMRGCETVFKWKCKKCCEMIMIRL